MTNKLTTKIILYCLIFPMTLIAQNTPLQIQDLTRLALKNNPDLQQSRLETQVTSIRDKQTWMQLLPQLDAVSGYINASGQNGVPDFVLANGLRERYGWLALHQTLFSGNLFGNLTQASLDHSRQKILQEQTRQQVLFDVVSAYFNALESQGEIKAYQANVRAFQMLFKKSQTLFQNGSVPELDVKKSEVELALQKSSLAHAHRKHQQDLNQIKVLIGRDVQKSLDLQTFTRRDTTLDSLEFYIALARQNQPELALQQVQRRQFQTMQRTSLLNRLPNASVDMDYGYDVLNPSPQSKPGWQVSLNLSLPLWHWNRQGQQYKIAGLRISQTQLQTQQVEQNITKQVNADYEECRVQQQQLLAMSESKIAAQEAVQMAQLGYQEGTVTNIEVINTQKLLTQTNINYLQALYEFYIAKARLYRDIGKLSEDSGWLK